MNITIYNWYNFKKYLQKNRIANVCIDFRGTLINPKRKNNFFRASKHLQLEEELLIKTNDIIPKIVLDKYKTEINVIDWSFVTCLEYYNQLNKYKKISIKEVEKIFFNEVYNYLHESEPLIKDKELVSLINKLNSINIKVFILADGLNYREKTLFSYFFPNSKELISGFYTSSDLKVNRLSEKFYIELAKKEKLNLNDLLVIGDRYDKDITIAENIGCKTIIVGYHNKVLHNTPSIKQLQQT